MITFKIHQNLFVFENKVILCLFRQFTLNRVLEKNNYASREAKMMSKLLSAPKKKRKLFFDSSVPTAQKAPKLGVPGNKENIRRISVLNSLFMKHISDILMNGNMASEVMDRNLEVSRVAVTPTFDRVNVFWGTNNEENAVALEAVLPTVGFSLRHELSQLQVMGVVPKIYFVRDKQLLNAVKVDHLLSIADYGEDHTPSFLGSQFKNPVTDVKPVIPKKEETSYEEEDLKEDKDAIFSGETMPVMRHDIFNLDHKSVMEKIAKLVMKSRAMHRFQPNLALDCEGVSDSYRPQPSENMTPEERKAAMAKFILSRKILQEKRYKNKYNSHLNLPPDNQAVKDEKDKYEDDEVDDYLDEEYFYEENRSHKQ